MSAWSLVCRPPLLSVRLRPEDNAPLPIRMNESRGFGSVLEPRYIFGADSLDQ